MCGIFCAVSKKNIINILLKGLHILEYRGYDSAGIAIIDQNKKIKRTRTLGKVNQLIKTVKSFNLSAKIGVSHTRWATHGKPSEKNAHPHISENIVVVHNGIIENYHIFRAFLKKCKYHFESETDTEVIAHLINWENKKKKNLHQSILKIAKKLDGSYSFVVMDSFNPNKLLAICYGSPLIIGCGNNENFIASDQLAILPITKKLIFLEIGDIAQITNNSIIITDINGNIVKRSIQESSLNFKNVEKGSYSFHMEKEIYEQPTAIKNTLNTYLNSNKIFFNKNCEKLLHKIQYIKIVACGTSYHAGILGKYWFEKFARITCDVEIASEFRYRKPVVLNNSLLIILSQSGETADTLAVLRVSKYLNYIGSLVICNVESSSLVREADVALITKAGIEISVASTKSFTAQLTILLLLIEKIRIIKNCHITNQENIINSLKKLPNRIEEVLLKSEKIKSLSKNFFQKNQNQVLFIGRGEQYPIAMEGALKLKEISYIHAEAYAAGELKHGALALIDENTPVIILAPSNNLSKKLKSNIEEIYSRGGILYIFADDNFHFHEDKDRIHIISIPCYEKITAPIVYSVAMQLFSYYVALRKKNDIDFPRNLAKSVTVE